MANQVTTQIVIDGPRNAIIKVTGILDTSNVAATQIVVPQNLFKVLAAQGNNPPLVRLNYVDYSITDQLEIQLNWGLAAAAGPGLPILPLAGRGRMNFDDFKGLPNNQAGSDGSIWLATTGWTSGVQVFTVILELIKSGLVYSGVQ